MFQTGTSTRRDSERGYLYEVALVALAMALAAAILIPFLPADWYLPLAALAAITFLLFLVYNLAYKGSWVRRK
jgi:hypothetical protein